jgi:bleomycin hydrolase
MTKKQIIKIFLIISFTSFLFVSCNRQETAKPNAFHNDVLLKTTPVKDQGKSELCWDYAMLATIETERLQLGDSVNLSPDYLARLWLQDQARTYYLTRGRVKVTLRGMMPMTLHLMERYGIQPFDSYHPFGAISYIALTKASMQVARASTSLRRLDDRLGDLLDKQIGYLPPTLFMLGMGYTPKQFAQSIYLPGNYIALTSFTHHPFGKPFVMESPDNRMLDSFYNIPIDQLMKTIISTLRHGHPVCWEGDISESGFDFYRGIAVLTNEDHKTTQQERQRAFEQFQTTDDHCMELCGLAHDRHGRLFFIAKNSWGTQNPYGGFMYLSYNYVRMKTIGVMVKR